MSNTDEIDHTQTKTFQENDVIPADKSTGDSNAKTSNIEQSVDKVSDAATDSKTKGWVHFEDEDTKKPQGENISRMENVDLSEKVITFILLKSDKFNSEQ